MSKKDNMAGPYRTNSPPEPEWPLPNWWQRHGYYLIDSVRVVGIVAMVLLIVAGMTVGVSAATMYVAEGFGFSGPSLTHYIVGFIVLNFFFTKVHRKD